MPTLNQLTSEIAHSIQQQDNVAAKRAIALSIIHSRNQLIRHSYEGHNYIDRGLQQRFRCELIDVPDGDLLGFPNATKIKRTKNKVPRPVRLTNNLPFSSVRTIGVENPIEIAFVRTATSKYYASLPGFCPSVTYDYLNDYIYIDTTKNDILKDLQFITVEAAFEYPNLILDNLWQDTKFDENGIIINSVEELDLYNGITAEISDKLIELEDNEFLIPEDMVNDIKKLTLETINGQLVKQTNEIPSQLTAQ